VTEAVQDPPGARVPGPARSANVGLRFLIEVGPGHALLGALNARSSSSTPSCSTSALLQATLVHGVAGVALAVFVVSLARRLGAAGGRTTALMAAGLAAAAVSLVQFAMEIALDRAADAGHVSASATFFHAVNVADTVKLVLLAVAVAAATRLAASAGAFPRWLRGLGHALVPALVLGGLAFVVTSDALSAVLALSLLLLLLWVGTVAVVAARRPA
jgi:hypothetical protein